MRETRSITEYRSKGKQIRKSRSHAEMWIVNHPNGNFHALNSSQEGIQVLHKPDKGTIRYGTINRSQLN